ncbi:hypothetical protein ACS0TY_001200 [Phlomoides rotata]
MVTVLRQKLQSHRRYWIDFNKWEVFVNDDCYTDISLSGSYNRRKASLRIQLGQFFEMFVQGIHLLVCKFNDLCRGGNKQNISRRIHKLLKCAL